MLPKYFSNKFGFFSGLKCFLHSMNDFLVLILKFKIWFKCTNFGILSLISNFNQNFFCLRKNEIKFKSSNVWESWSKKSWYVCTQQKFWPMLYLLARPEAWVDHCLVPSCSCSLQAPSLSISVCVCVCVCACVYIYREGKKETDI
jgi:hypothetical protein